MTTSSTLFLVTNCSATKKISSGEPVCLRNYNGSLCDKFHAWKSTIDGVTNCMPARRCYGGDSWCKVLLAEESALRKCELWVVSAGMGLISADKNIPNYSATFATGNEDTICCELKDKIQWWRLLTDWQREKSGVGCISDLARQNPDGVFLVALSATYFKVLQNDLCNARDNLNSPDNLMVISMGIRNCPELGECLLPADARFESILGGVRATLNARLLLHIVENCQAGSMSGKDIREYLRNISEGLDGPRIYDRKKVSNADVKIFIENRVEMSGKLSPTVLLKMFRDEGFACEQKRFRQIYEDVTR